MPQNAALFDYIALTDGILLAVENMLTRPIKAYHITSKLTKMQIFISLYHAEIDPEYIN